MYKFNFCCCERNYVNKAQDSLKRKVADTTAVSDGGAYSL